MNAATILKLGMEISIFLSVLSLGMRASLDDVAHLFRRSGQLIKALLAIYVIMPIVAIVMVKNFDLNPVIKVVLVTLSISPIPPLFPKKAFKSGGKASFTFGLLAAVSLLSIIAIPIAFVVFGAVFVPDTQFPQTWLLKTVLLKILFPMVVGMLLRRFASAFSERYADLLGKLGGILLIVSILPILIILLPVMWSLIGNFTLLAFILFSLIGVAVGYFLGGPDSQEKSVLALGTISRHPGIAIALASANIDGTPKNMIAAAVILYLLISALVSSPFLKWLRRT